MDVRSWMRPDPQTATPRTTIAEARRRMHTYGVRHLPIVDRDKLVGIVSDRDVRSQTGLARDDDDEPVATVMSTPTWTVREDADMAEAARTMLSRRVSCLPVVDADGLLVGLVTTTDCLLAMLERIAEPAG